MGVVGFVRNGETRPFPLASVRSYLASCCSRGEGNYECRNRSAAAL